MILQALNDYYDRLAADPHSGVAKYGYSAQKAAFEIVIEPDGTDFRVESLLQGEKQRPTTLIVPGLGARSGKTPPPNWFWDNALYIFGIPPKGRTKAWAKPKFDAFLSAHLALEGAIVSEDFQAFLGFLRLVSQGDERATLSTVNSYVGVFRIRNRTRFLHEDEAVREWWKHKWESSSASDGNGFGQCLVSGQVESLASSHFPKIKGIKDAPGKPSEKYLIAIDSSFRAAESYGKRTNLNAPVSQRAAFGYCTSLNRLLEPSSRRRMSVGDTSVVFWTEKPSPAEDFLADIINPSMSAEDETRIAEVRTIIDAIAHGKYPPELGSEQVKFYVLGLAPNAARISVRFWHVSTLGELVENLREHFEALDIVQGPNDLPHPPLWRLLRETARETKDIPDLLEGALLRSILTGQPYPQMFYAALLRRLKADREIRHVRAAAIKACLIRIFKKEVSVALNPEHPDQAYQLGRLFAALEKTQQDALPNINDTIKDRYFSAASSTPASVFPRIIKLNQHHLGKLERGSRTFHERRIQEIAGRIDTFPSHLGLEQQGLFAIGYYHQRQDIFTKKAKEEVEAEAAG